MVTEFKQHVAIGAPAEKVWRIVAHDFDGIGRWASAITESSALPDRPAPEGAAVGGRVCANSVPGFGDVSEQFTYYDEQGMRFGYEATDGLPAFVKRAENNWSVRSTGPDQAVVEARGEIELNLVPGLLLVPLIRLQMGRLAGQAMEELKYFVEHDQPHPRKRKLSGKPSQTTGVGS